MPPTYLIPKIWLPLLHDFREYLAYRSVYKGYFDTSLPDYKMKSLLYLLDMPDCGDIVANWWS